MGHYGPGDEDFVLRYLRLLSAGALDPAHDPARAGRELHEALASPAAEVRLAAAREIARLGKALPPFEATESERIRGRIATEPASDVRRALRNLLQRR